MRFSEYDFDVITSVPDHAERSKPPPAQEPRPAKPENSERNAGEQSE